MTPACHFLSFVVFCISKDYFRYKKEKYTGIFAMRPLVLYIYKSVFNTVDSRYNRITAYLEVKIWSLPKHENLTTGKKYCGKEEKLLLISPLFHNIFSISLTSRVQLHICLLNVVNWIIFSSILQIWYVEVRISRSSSESPLEFEITRVDYMSWGTAFPSKL